MDIRVIERYLSIHLSFSWYFNLTLVHALREQGFVHLIDALLQLSRNKIMDP